MMTARSEYIIVLILFVIALLILLLGYNIGYNTHAREVESTNAYVQEQLRIHGHYHEEVDE